MHFHHVSGLMAILKTKQINEKDTQKKISFEERDEQVRHPNVLFTGPLLRDFLNEVRNRKVRAARYSE